MRYEQGKIRALLAQQSGQIQFLIIAPILTLSFLSLVVRTANSAIDPSLEKKKVNQQLKQRILEVRGADPQRLPDVEARVQAPPPPGSWRVVTEQSPLSFSLTPLAVETEEKTLSRERSSEKRSDTWEIVHGNNFAPALLAYTPTLTPDKKKSALVTIDNPDEIKKAIAHTQAKKPVQSPVVTAALAPVPLPVPAPVKEEVIPFPPAQVIHTIKKQETLEKIFKRIGLPSKEAAKWLSAAKKTEAFRNLRPKQTLALNFIEDSFNLQSVVYEIEPDTRAILERKAKDKVNARLEEPPVQPVLLVLGGKVNSSLTKTLRKSGLPARMTEGVAALTWDVDLADLRKVDSFKVLLEAVQKGEKIVTYKRVLAAEVTHDEVTYAAFSIPEERRLRKKKAVALRYKGEGLNIESDGEKFLKFPLEFTRVSSTFAASRFHPILHRSRAHRGIDFAAPRGTPVYSVASGIVTFAGRQSGYGNLVKIDHPGPYETGYAHLQDYADGIIEGAAVERGQVIGSVGSTGLATGPHLHFELYKDGEFVNPFGESAVETASASEEIKEEEPPVVVDPIIEKKKERLAEQLATLEIGGQQLTSLVIPLQKGPAATGIAAQRTGRPMASGK